ncbi:MAG: hypothetical protein QOC98_965 [Frankiaceae bacterium]|nr:hypothetical protein [Frankiaceae bacterium]
MTCTATSVGHQHAVAADPQGPGEHDRDDEHGHGLLGRLRHAAGELFGGHEHDSEAGTLDDVLGDRAGRRALVISLVVLGVTAVLQIAVALVSGSVALLGDAVHNVADALTALPLFVAFALSRRPASRRFTYGYGRSEDLAGLVIVLVIAASAAVSGYVAIERLVHPRSVDHLVAVAAAALIGFVGNEVVARYRISVGRHIGSAALVADGLHARTDGFTSLAVLAGAGGVALGFPLADPVVGLLITLLIVGVLRSAAREVVARVLDAVDPALVASAEQAVSTVPGVVSVSELRIRWIGRALRAEVGLEVDPGMSLTEAHDLARHAENHLLEQVPHLRAAIVATRPAGRNAPLVAR